jgi:Sigma-70, region 4
LGRPDRVSVVSSDVIQAVHEELARLPEKYRTPLVLCDLEGKTQAKAANEIGCPIGTVHSRLARGRERLRERLRRRGLDAPDGAIGSTLGAESARAALPAALKGKVAQAAARVAAGASPLGVVPTSVATLAQSLLKELMMANLKRAGSIVLALSLAVGGVPVVAWQHQAAPSAAALSQALRAPDLAAASGDSGKSAQAARAVRDPQRRVLALVQAAEAQSASGARDSAAATLREALGMAVALPVDTYAHATERWILMSDIGAAQARAGDFDAALLSVAEISKPIGPVENLKDNEKESPIDRIYEEIARTHAGSHRYLKAELAMSKLANGLQKDAVLAAIGDAKAEEGDWDGAERTISFVGFLVVRFTNNVAVTADFL